MGPSCLRMHSLSLFILALISVVSASINCVQPQAGSEYSVGQGLVFDWGSDDSHPTVNDVKSITATLYCNTGAKIADFPLPIRPPYTGTVPFVGNATTAGGTQGPCANNAFHVEYKGFVPFSSVIDVGLSPFGPITCGSIIIKPAANNSFPITTTTTTSSSTTTRSSTTSSSPTESGNSTGESSGISTSVVIIIVVVCIVILVLAGIAVAWYLRKKRIERMEAVIMPWKRQDQPEFAKVASLDESRSNISDAEMHSAAAGAGAAGALYNNKNKSQPQVGGAGRFNAYERQASMGPGGGYQRPMAGGGYDDVSGEEDNYYNPYYAQSAAAAAAAANMPRVRPSYYSGFTTSDYSAQSPFADPYPQQQETKTYFPPPPSSALYPNSSTSSLPISAPMVGPHASGAYASSALNILPTSGQSSPRRAPQSIPEKGHLEKDEHEAHPMQDMHKVEVPKTT